MIPIEEAICHFESLEQNILETFESGLNKVAKATADATQMYGEVESIGADLTTCRKQTTSAVDVIQTLNHTCRIMNESLKECVEATKQYGTRLAILETNLEHVHRADAKSSRRCKDFDKDLHRVSEELSMLAFNCASAGVSHEGQTSSGCMVDRAFMAAKLLRKRSMSCPPKH